MFPSLPLSFCLPLSPLVLLLYLFLFFVFDLSSPLFLPPSLSFSPSLSISLLFPSPPLPSYFLHPPFLPLSLFLSFLLTHHSVITPTNLGRHNDLRSEASKKSEPQHQSQCRPMYYMGVRSRVRITFVMRSVK